MELGQRLKQARLEAGLSQRQLCGDQITRNMLSQIENGTARPSMDTLQYLASQLGKPMGYFLEEQAVTSPNQAIMAQARAASAADVLEILSQYQTPDPVFDAERWLLEALACLALAGTAISENRLGYAAKLLERAAHAGAATPYYTPDLERRRVLLCFQAKTDSASSLLENNLPDNLQEVLLRATAAIEQNDPIRGMHILETAQTHDAHWCYLMGECHLAQKNYAVAAEHYRKAEQSPAVYAKLELCYRELEDYKQAYFYACKQK